MSRRSRRRRRVDGQRIDHRGQLRNHRGLQQLAKSVSRRTPAPQVSCDHRVQPQDRGIQPNRVDLPFQMRNQRGHRGAHRNPGYHNCVGLRLYPAHHGAHLRHRTHHARDVAKRIHVRVGRPLATSATVAGLHWHRDVEPQLVMYASDPRQHQVFCAALTGAMHPHQPRPRAIGCRHRCTTARAGPPTPSASSVFGSAGSCSNVIRS